MADFLDTNGLRLLWSKIKALVVGKADKVANAVSGNFAGLDSTGNLTDSGYSPSDLLELAVNVTYSELKALRDGGNLIPGKWYRITDYNCTTTQENTQSAGHVFDVIVHADDESHLNENAYAAHHEGDTYFQDCKLEAWELKYCLDNDIGRFSWADTTNGKGIIYYMKDEGLNECPYDFKNIMFKRWAITDLRQDRVNLNGAYVGILGANPLYISIDDKEDFCWAYTFNGLYLGVDEEPEDRSLFPYENIVYGNVILKNSFRLNNIVLIGDDMIHNQFGYNCEAITLCTQSAYNSFGDQCSAIILGESSWYNSFAKCSGNISSGVGLYITTVDTQSGEISFGEQCFGITIGSCCVGLHFGNICEHITVFNNVLSCFINMNNAGTQQSPFKNAHILSGTKGDIHNPLTIDFEQNQDRTQVACLDSNGQLVIYYADDLAMKTSVVTLTISSVTQELSDNTIYQCSTLNSLTISIPNTVTPDYISKINFTSGSTATTLTAPNSILWRGDDVSNGSFVPVANKRYVISLCADGTYAFADVKGYAVN